MLSASTPGNSEENPTPIPEPRSLVRDAIAANVRRERLSQGRTLRELADSARISAALLSQIEHGNANPTLDVLTRIAHTLRLPFTDLTSSITRAPRVLRAGEGPRWVDRTNGQVTVDVFSSERKSHFVVSNAYLPANTTASPTSHGAGTTEYVYVIAGYVTVTCDDWSETLMPGDAIEFAGESIHTYEAGTDAVELMIIVAFADGSGHELDESEHSAVQPFPHLSATQDPS